MKLAIKFSSDYISVIEYKDKAAIQVTKCIQTKMPEGAFANGIVVNTNEVSATLKKLLKEHHVNSRSVVLCVGGMDVINKEISIPKSAKRHVRGLLRSELMKSDALRNGYLFDYILGESTEEDLQNYHVYLMPAELVHNYEQTMQRAGLNLERVEPINHSMEKLARLLSLDTREGLSILVDAEKTGIDILMIGGGAKNVYRNIQLAEENIEENVFIVSAIQNMTQSEDPMERSYNSLMEAISRLLQFQFQSGSDNTVDQILIYGNLAEREDILTRIEERTGISTRLCEMPEHKVQFSNDRYPVGGSGYSAIGCVSGNMLGESKQLSFIKLPEEADTITLKDRLPVFIGLACLVGLSISYAALAVSNAGYNRKNSRLSSDIAAIEQSEEYQRKVEVQQEILRLSTYNENCSTCIDTLEKAEAFQAAEFRQIDALVPEGIAITGYEYEGNIIRFYCTAASQDGPAAFAKLVTDAGVFEHVNYTGFSAYQTQDFVVYYSFQLECSH